MAVPNNAAPNSPSPLILFGMSLRKIRLYIEAKRAEEAHKIANHYASSLGYSEQVGNILFAFASQAPLKSYTANSQIFVEGSDSQETYLVLQGKVRIQRVGQGELEEVEPGEFFGEFEALAQTNRSASAIAVVNTHTLRLPKSALSQLAGFIPPLLQWFKSNMRDRILAQLSQPNSLFDNLSYEDRIQLMNALTFKSAMQGDAIITEGDPPSGLRIVYSGWLDVWKKSADSMERCVATLGPGDIFGEGSLLLARQCNATVKCSTPVTYLELNPLSFYQALPNVSGLREKLIALIQHRQTSSLPNLNEASEVQPYQVSANDLMARRQVAQSLTSTTPPYSQAVTSAEALSAQSTPSAPLQAGYPVPPQQQGGLPASYMHTSATSDGLPRVNMSPSTASAHIRASLATAPTEPQLQRQPSVLGTGAMEALPRSYTGSVAVSQGMPVMSPIPASQSGQWPRMPQNPNATYEGLPPQYTGASPIAPNMPQGYTGALPLTQGLPQGYTDAAPLAQGLPQSYTGAAPLTQGLPQSYTGATPIPQGLPAQYTNGTLQSGQWPAINPGVAPQQSPMPQYVAQPVPAGFITNLGLQALQIQQQQNAQIMQSGAWVMPALSPSPSAPAYFTPQQPQNFIQRQNSQIAESAGSIESASSRESFQGRVCPKCGFKDAGSICVACGAYLDD